MQAHISDFTANMRKNNSLGNQNAKKKKATKIIKNSLKLTDPYKMKTA